MMLQMTKPQPEPLVPMANTCLGVKRDGERCQSQVLVGGSDYCYSHDPRVSDAERYAARAKGGYNSASPARLEKSLARNPTLRGILDFQALTADKVFQGDIPPGVGTSVASLTRSMVATIQLVADAEKAAILAELLNRLESGMLDIEDITDLDEDEDGGASE